MGTDHIAPKARLALEALRVCREQPDWRLELLTTLVVVLALCVAATLGQLYVQRNVARENLGLAEFWKQRAERIQTLPAVQLEPNGSGFRCRAYNVRWEWEAAVASECEKLGRLLTLARATP